MYRITSTTELQTELRRLLRYAERRPSRYVLARALADIATRMNSDTASAVAVFRRFAKMFTSPEAMQEYLKSHPKADPAKHSVKQKDPGASKKPRAKKPKPEAEAKKPDETKKPDDGKLDEAKKPDEKKPDTEEKKIEPKEDPRLIHKVPEHFVSNVKEWYDGDMSKDSPMGKLLSEAESGQVHRKTILDVYKSLPNANEYPKDSAKAKYLGRVNEQLHKLYDN